MGVPILEPPVTHWECGHCNTRDQTREVEPHTRFHACPGLGMTAPMVLTGSGSIVVKNLREDYIAGGDVQFDADGKPVSSITTQHPDGRQDCVVYAPTAHAGAGA